MIIDRSLRSCNISKVHLLPQLPARVATPTPAWPPWRISTFEIKLGNDNSPINGTKITTILHTNNLTNPIITKPKGVLILLSVIHKSWFRWTQEPNSPFILVREMTDRRRVTRLSNERRWTLASVFYAIRLMLDLSHDTIPLMIKSTYTYEMERANVRV